MNRLFLVGVFAAVSLPSLTVGLVNVIRDRPIVAVADTGLVCHKPVRHPATVLHFHQLTGYPTGRPGYVVDHIVPLCACGRDTVSNMQWQRTDSGKAKDAWEREMCKALEHAP